MNFKNNPVTAVITPVTLLIIIIISGSLSTINQQRRGRFMDSVGAALEQGDVAAHICIIATVLMLLYVLYLIVRWRW